MQYRGVESLFPLAKHKKVNHKKGEFVALKDKTNTINSLESSNKYMKKEVICRKSDAIIDRYISLYYYKNHRLNLTSDIGKKVQMILTDIAIVFLPGATGLQLAELVKPTADELGIRKLLPDISNRLSFLDSDLRQ